MSEMSLPTVAEVEARAVRAVQQRRAWVLGLRLIILA